VKLQYEHNPERSEVLCKYSLRIFDHQDRCQRSMDSFRLLSHLSLLDKCSGIISKR
jgi:hypothetical protein